jgi:hypothetical protein
MMFITAHEPLSPHELLRDDFLLTFFSQISYEERDARLGMSPNHSKRIFNISKIFVTAVFMATCHPRSHIQSNRGKKARVCFKSCCPKQGDGQRQMPQTHLFAK